MEEEQMFLYVAFYSSERPHTVIGDVMNRHFDNVIRRCTTQYQKRGEEQYKRVHIEFDPINEKICFPVAITSAIPQDGAILNDQIEFIGVFQTLEEADKLKDALAGGGYKEYVKGKSIFNKVEVYTCVIKAV